MATEAKDRPMALRASDYHAAAQFDRERRAVLAESWTPVCRSDELDGIGAQKAVEVACTPILLTRDRAGKVHAISNVCRHRGMILVESDTRAEAIRCPYHLWTYRLDGSLAAAPHMEGGDLDGCNLPRYAADEWGGFVFVNLGVKPEPLKDFIAPLEPVFDGPSLAVRKIGARLVFDHAWNWKVMLENFGESYHHIGTHAETLQPLWPGAQTDASPSGPRWLDIRHPDHPEAGSLRVFVAFPLFLLAHTTADDAVIWYRLVPLGPEKIALEIIGLYAPDVAADAEQMERARAQLFLIHQEDMEACRRVQAGLRSPDAVLGPLSPLEQGIACFRQWLADALARSGSA